MSTTLLALVMFFMVGLAEAQPETTPAKDGASTSTAAASVTPAPTPSAEIVPTTATHGAVPQGVLIHPSANVAGDLNTTMVLSLHNVPIDQLVRFMADTTGKTVIKQKDINTQISVSSPKPVSKRQALELIYSALQLDNIFVAEQDNMLQVINFSSVKNIKLESIPAAVDVQTLEDSLRIVQKIYKFDNISPESVRRHLELFMPNTSISIETASNTLILTDQLKRIKGYDKILKALDAAPQDKAIEIYNLTTANAADLAMLLRNMIASGALAGTPVTSTTQSGEETPLVRPTRGGSDIVLIPDGRLNRLIALCPVAQKPLLDQLIRAFDMDKTEDHVVQIYKLKNTDAYQLMGLINTIITNKGLRGAPVQGAPGASGVSPVGATSGKRGSRYWKHLAENMASAAGKGKPTQAGDVMLIPEIRLNWIIAVVRPDLKPQLDELVKQFDIERTLPIQARTIELKGANAISVASSIARLIGDMPVTSIRDYIRILPTEDNGRLIVVSSEANYKVVEELIATVGIVPDGRILQIYQLTSAEASQLAVLINAIIANKGLEGPPASMDVATSGTQGGRFSRRIAETSGRGAGRSVQAGDVLLIPETRLNWIITIMRPELKDDVDALVKQFDVDKTSDIKPRLLALKGGNAGTMTGTLIRMLDTRIITSPRDYIRIMPTEDNAQLIVHSTEANYKMVQELVVTIGTAPSNKLVHVYKIANADVSQLLSVITPIITSRGLGTISMMPVGGSGSYGGGYGYFMRRMMESQPVGTTTADIQFMPDARTNWLMVIVKPELKPELDALIQQFDVESSRDVTARVVEVKPGTAQSLASTINNLLQYQEMNGPRDVIRVTPGEDNSRLIVLSSEANYKVVQEYVKTLGINPVNKIVSVYKITYTDVSQIITVLNSVITSKGLGTTSLNSAGVSGGYGGGGFRYYMRRMMEAQSVGGATAPDIQFLPDTRNNTLIVIMKAELKPELDVLIKQFDVESGRDMTARIIAVKPATAQSMASTINNLLQYQEMDGPRDMIRVTAAEDNSRLIVFSSEANFKLVQEFVTTIDISPVKKIVNVYKVAHTEVSQLISVLNSVIASKGLGTTSLSPAGGSGGYGGSRSFFHRMMEAQSMGGSTGSPDIQFLPDTRNNALIVIMKAELKPELDVLIQQFDVESSRDVTVRIIEVKPATAQSLASTISNLLQYQEMDSPRDMIRVTAAEDNSRLIVFSSETNFKLVQEFVTTIDISLVKKIVNVYKVAHTDVSQLISVLNSVIASKGLGTTSLSPAGGSGGYGGGPRSFFRRMMEAQSMGGSSASPDIQFLPDTRNNTLIVIMKAELKPELDALIQQFDVESSRDVTVRIIEVKPATAQSLASTISNLLQYQDMDSPRDMIRVTAAEDNSRLIVFSSETNFKLVQDFVKTIDISLVKKIVNVYKITHADVNQLITVLNSVITSKGLGTTSLSPASGTGSSGGPRSFFRRMMEAQSMGGSSASPDIQFLPDTRNNTLIVIMKAEIKPELDALIQQFDVESSRDVTARIIEVKPTTAQSMAATITNLLQYQDMDGPRDTIRVTAAEDNARLIVLSSEANFKLVQDFVKTIGTGPNNKEVLIYKITYAEVNQLISVLNTVITNKGLGTTSMTPVSGSSGGYGGGGFRSYFRRMMETQSMGGGQTVPDIMFIPEARSNQLIAIVKPELKPELDKLIKQFDVESGKDVTARIIEVKNATAQKLAMTVSNLLQGQDMDSPRDMIKVTPAEDNAKLIVLSSEANFKVVQELVNTIDSVPDDRIVDVYKLQYADAIELTTLLTNVIGKSPMSKGGATGGAGGYGSSSGDDGSSMYSRYSRFLGGGGGGGGGYGGYGGRRFGGFGGANAIQAGNITLIPEVRLNWIIAISPREQKEELDKLVLQFDIEKPRDLQVRILDVKFVSAQDLALTLSNLLMQQGDTGRREYVRVSATEDNKRLMIWSTEVNFKNVQEMVKTLDVETPKDVRVRMINVQYADPIGLATTINSVFREQSSGGGYYDYYFGGGGGGRSNTNRKDSVRVSATEDGKRLMVLSSEENFKAIEEIMTKLDTPDSESQVTRVFKVENLEVQGLADQLTRLFQERNANQRGGGYFGYYGGGNNSTQTPNPSIVPSPRNNTLMVMARPKDLPFLEQMVKELDIPIDPKDFEPRIYRIRNTDAAEVVNVLQNLFAGRQSTARTTNIFFDSWRPNRSSDQDSIEAVFGKLKFVVDRVTNTIVALSSNTKNYEIIDAVIQKLDTPDPESSEVMVFDLKYADALKVANQMNYLFSEGTVQRAPTTSNAAERNVNNNGEENSMLTMEEEQEQDFVPLWGSTGGGTNSRNTQERPINTMIGSVRVVPDVRANKIMVACPAVYFPTLTRLVESLDHAEPQVYITTRILEITRGRERRVGIRWTPDPSSIDPGELDGAVLALSQLGFIDTFGSSGQYSGTASTLPGIGYGTKNWTPSKDGSSIISSNVNIALVVQLLLKNTQSRVFTEPGITVNNNETGNIFFGTQVALQAGVQTYDTGARNTDIIYKDVGISLGIRPHINSRDEVVLKTKVENSNVRPELVNGQVAIDDRKFTTNVSLKSGETMVIGGITIDDGQKIRRGVPILGSLPVLKYIFGKSDDTRSLRELVFFVTPKVIQSSQDTNEILKNANESIKTIEEMDLKNPEKLEQLEKIKPNAELEMGLEPDDRVHTFKLHRRPPPEDEPQAPPVLSRTGADTAAPRPVVKEVGDEEPPAVAVKAVEAPAKVTRANAQAKRVNQ